MSQHDQAAPLGAAEAFPSTRWSWIAASPERDIEERREAFAVLAARYWRPIASYVRTRWAKTDDEAREETQEFFLWMLEGDFLARADPARGRLRGFIKRSLANFLHDRERKRRTEKRGGSTRFQALVPSGDEDAQLELPDPRRTGPEEHLDSLWRRELLAQAADALEAELRGRKRGATAFAVFRDYFLGDEALEYADLAERYSITTVDVSNFLTQAKKRYRTHLRTAVLETVHNDDDLRAELAWLFESSPPPSTDASSDSSEGRG